MQRISSLAKNRNTWIAATAVTTTAGAVYLNRRRALNVQDTRNVKSPKVSKPVTPTVKEEQKAKDAFPQAKSSAAESRSTAALSAKAKPSVRSTFKSFWRTQNRVETSGFNARQTFDSMWSSSKKMVQTPIARNIGLLIGGLFLADRTVKLGGAIAHSNRQPPKRNFNGRFNLNRPAPMKSKAIVKIVPPPPPPPVKATPPVKVQQKNDPRAAHDKALKQSGFTRKAVASAFLLLTQAAVFAVKNTALGKLLGINTISNAQMAANRFIPIQT